MEPVLRAVHGVLHKPVRSTVFGNGQTQAQRFEYKYLIDEARADLVRSFALCHLCADSHTDAAHNNEYPVYSLYLDTAGLGLYQSTVAGEKNRFKLRVRCYDDEPDTPAFAEIKARANDVILKKRAPVRKDALGRVLGSFCMSTGDLSRATPSDRFALDRFCELCAKLSARPKVLVRYMREAYVDPDGRPLRLTMDRDITCLRTDAATFELDGPGWVSLGGPVVLEIKFTDTFPDWAHDMVWALSLRRTACAKYVRSVDALARSGMGTA